MKKFFILAIALVVFNACDRELSSDTPLVFTGDVTELTDSGVWLSGNFSSVNTNEALSFGFLGSFNSSTYADAWAKYPILASQKGIANFFLTDPWIFDTVYYVRAYADFSDYTIYGNIVSFATSGTRQIILEGIYPETATYGDTIAIFGTHLNQFKDSQRYFFNQDYCAPIKSTPDTVWVVVPYFSEANEYFSTGKLNVYCKLGDLQSNSLSRLKIGLPKVNYFYPKEGFATDTLCIYGSGFLSHATRVYWGDYLVENLRVENDSIEVIMPALFDDYTRELKIDVAGKSAKIGSLSIKCPQVTSFLPSVSFPGDTVTLYGKYLDHPSVAVSEFSPMMNSNILLRSPDSLSFKLWGWDCMYIFSRLFIVGETTQPLTIPIHQPQNFQVQDPDQVFFGRRNRITGDYLPEDKSDCEMLINGAKCRIREMNRNYIEFILPDDLYAVDGWCDIYLTLCYNKKFTLYNAFQIAPPRILSSPQKVRMGERFEIVCDRIGSEQEVDVYLDEELLTDVTTHDSTLRNIYMPYWAHGSFTLSIVRNGQKSINNPKIEVLP